jgi:hypothetical protein
MKRIILSTCCFISFGAFSQTYTFTKNQEIARIHELKNESTAYYSLFETTTSITSDYLVELSSIMDFKDGYVKIDLIDEHTLRVLHESFIETKDIIDVLNFNNLTWIHSTRELTTFK